MKQTCEEPRGFLPREPPPVPFQLQLLGAPACFVLWIIYSPAQTRMTSAFKKALSALLPQFCSLPVLGHLGVTKELLPVQLQCLLSLCIRCMRCLWGCSIAAPLWNGSGLLEQGAGTIPLLMLIHELSCPAPHQRVWQSPPMFQFAAQIPRLQDGQRNVTAVPAVMWHLWGRRQELAQPFPTASSSFPGTQTRFGACKCTLGGGHAAEC